MGFFQYLITMIDIFSQNNFHYCNYETFLLTDQICKIKQNYKLNYEDTRRQKRLRELAMELDTEASLTLLDGQL